MPTVHRFKTISAFHEFRNFPKPAHPLFSMINVGEMPPGDFPDEELIVQDFYLIALKRGFTAKMKYGQQVYDFDEGIMAFMAPGQVFSIGPKNGEMKQSGWMIYIHPDFLWNTPLANKIKQYEFFDYAVNEALFLSEKEEATIGSIIEHIAQEYNNPIDRFSQDIIVAQLEVLLTYAERFYQRQFVTRKVSSHQLLTRLEEQLNNWFMAQKGLPSVKEISAALHVSPNYLSGVLKSITGKSTLQHIQDKVIAVAKEKLSTTDMSVSEIAYELGFDYPQTFSKLFKAKTAVSPLEFRQSFN
ncbi:AraC family transcriptional regulator [Chitinophaga sp. sic0106]|uniref:helix-turn-helix domain-containing protein n=1 Tax=Chitinophaga sp. sic0106 TaxID=2854785 RepID=UPI001C440B77|nr:helix-turn-helix transcriptional regulator [Chitinophaga sp. sic0106]MBV7530694.1 helix-turn-helix transcriptional regulator [Chitinophaga sp. sic0106]